MKYSLSKYKIISLIGLFLVFYNEFLVYWICYLNWPAPHKTSLFYYKNRTIIKNLNDRPIRLLLVADPQLIGENDEPWFYSWIARWDSDRYLRSSFILANSYVKPDATIYLGDLFDEGLKATDEQFERYYRRFRSIFQFDKMRKKYGIKQIFIPGDNDIGGEYIGDRNDELANRFQRYFGSNIDLFDLNSYTKFIKLDLDYTVSFYRDSKRNKVIKILSSKSNDQSQHDTFTILLNHISLIRKSKEELEALIKDTRASLIIKGDSHLFELIKYDMVNKRVQELTTFKSNPSNYYILNLQSDKSEIEYINEISIPTCSYRMGVPHMGYGMLTLTPNGKAYVSILWLPSRFNCIKIYLIFIFTVLAYFIFNNVFKRIYKRVCVLIANKIA